MTDLTRRVDALESRAGGNLRTFHVVRLYDDDYNVLDAEEQERKLAETRAAAGPDDVILKVVLDE